MKFPTPALSVAVRNTFLEVREDSPPRDSASKLLRRAKTGPPGLISSTPPEAEIADAAAGGADPQATPLGQVEAAVASDEEDDECTFLIPPVVTRDFFDEPPMGSVKTMDPFDDTPKEGLLLQRFGPAAVHFSMPALQPLCQQQVAAWSPAEPESPKHLATHEPLRNAVKAAPGPPIKVLGTFVNFGDAAGEEAPKPPLATECHARSQAVPTSLSTQAPAEEGYGVSSAPAGQSARRSAGALPTLLHSQQQQPPPRRRRGQKHGNQSGGTAAEAAARTAASAYNEDEHEWKSPGTAAGNAIYPTPNMCMQMALPPEMLPPYFASYHPMAMSEHHMTAAHAMQFSMAGAPQQFGLPPTMEPASGVPLASDSSRHKPTTGTTLVLQNLPLNYRRGMLLRMLEAEGFARDFDFVYLPMDFKTRAGLGYAFINLVDASVVPRFWQAFDGYKKWAFRSNKVCSVNWCVPHQGLEAHINRYRNSALMHESVPDEYKPVMFSGGVRVPFPKPTRKLEAPRQQVRAKARNGDKRQAAD